MTIVNITPPSKQIPPEQFSLFALGFRPFFLLAGFAAVTLVLGWVLLLVSDVEFNSYYGVAGWHSHEILFGFATAVIAGFLLTAAKNWTNVQTLNGVGLVGLVLLWLLARVVALFPHVVPPWIIALLDLAFIPILVVALAVPILKANKKPQLVFVAVLTVMFIANVMTHSQLLGYTSATFEIGTTLMMNCVLLVIAIMAGRVVPFFTERGAQGAEPKKWPWIEKLAIISLVVLLLAELFVPASQIVAICFGVASVAHAVRLFGWYSHRVWSVPLLWVLHLGYSWLVLGLALKTLALMGIGSDVIALHALAAAIGVLCLGMMARVALGHTGRKLDVAKVMAWAFALLNLAMVVRVFVPMLIPGAAEYAIVFSGALWCAAFVVFLAVYIPILVRARVDGQPG
ncbi:NnrS family protein [Pseudomonadota bacterium]